MILPKFEYKKAQSLEEAMALYSSYDQRALFLAGGTDLIPRLKHRLQKPFALIDLKGIRELKMMEEEDGWIRIGGLVTLYELKEDGLIKEYFPALYRSLDATSCETLQMRGTIGGNILQDTRCLFYNQSEFWRRARGPCLKMGGGRCNVTGGKGDCLSNYCSDSAPSLLSLNTKVRLLGLRGEREIPLEDLYTGRGEEPLGLFPGEILIEVLIPKKKTKGGYEKLRLRGSMDYPLLSVAFSVSKGKGRFVVGAIGPKPVVYELQDPNEESILALAERASEDAKAVDNTVMPASYRKAMVEVMARRVMMKVVGEV